METFSALLAICAGNSPVPVNSPHKGQWRGALMFSLIYAWINDWVNNREAGDLRRQRGHYDVSIMDNFFIRSAYPRLYLYSYTLIDLWLMVRRHRVNDFGIDMVKFCGVFVFIFYIYCRQIRSLYYTLSWWSRCVFWISFLMYSCL